MSTPAEPEPQRIRLGQRARSVPHKKPFIEAIAFTAAFYLCLAATLATLFSCFVLRKTETAQLLGIFVTASGVLWLLSFLRRRTPRCPLCKGTPLADSSARKHTNAKRFFPLNYGTSNVIRCIFKQKYLCPYCGTPFDLLKKIDRQGRNYGAPDPTESPD
jgi:hypothetical protein